MNRQTNERELVKIILRHPEAIEGVTHRVSEKLFLDDALSTVVYHALLMRKDKSFIDLIPLCKRIGQDALNSIGGPGFVGLLFSEPVLPAMAEEFLRDLEEAETRRRGSIVCDHIKELLGSPKFELSDSAALVDSLSAMFVGQSSAPERIKHISKYLAKVVDDIETARSKTGKIEYPSTGLPFLDYLIGGLVPSTYMIIAGETSGGKTALGLQLAREFSIKDGNSSLVITYEMPGHMLTSRLMATDSGVGMKAMKTGLFTEDQLRKFESSMARVNDSKMYIMDVAGEMKVAEMRAVCRDAVEKYGIKMVVVDYLQLIPPTNVKDSRERQVAEMSFQLQKMAQELGLCVIAMSQLNDDGKLRESRAIGHDADVVMILEGDNEHPPRVLKIVKNRNGELGRVPLEFDGLHQRFLPRD